MPGASLTVDARLVCPHRGTVAIVSSNTRASAGARLVTTDDAFTVGGCQFTLPGPTPSPCVSVRWIVPAGRVRVGGAPGLDTSSIGLCLSAAGAPQGRVVVSSTQPSVTGQ